MPTYEYECTGCEHRFEVFQSFKEDPIKICPQCGKEVKRLMGSGVNFIFKGSGFYQTDYRSQEYKQKVKDESKSSSKTEAKAEPKTESKKEAKTETKTEPKSESKIESKSVNKTEGAVPVKPKETTAEPKLKTSESSTNPKGEQ